METRYRNLIITDAKDSPTTDEIQAIEKLLKTKLTDDFIEFLYHANGAYLNYCVRISEINDILSFNAIFSTRKLNEYGSEYNTFLFEITESQKSSIIPKKVLPFAVDGGGSTLYLDLSVEGNGRIVSFVHGLPE